ncbi:hypothetical protein PCC7424_1188 [Gloeothece citriformis PCC 7424]|uniref:Amidase n=1 Tax=Gloeothece citriformis (strain PCC 7424) TaxID=65393 RepID=B7K770_GLOC7|nr:hypothetical protein [Gloeothece citriformis]ACK69638.1 hypothetical protein PCC7424_1188 [Gloeothece citriformis PCC 7424]
MYNTDFLDLTARQLVEGYKAKKFSPVEVTEAAIARIEACNKVVNAMVYVDEYLQEIYYQAAREKAKESAARWEKGEPLSRVLQPAPSKMLLICSMLFPVLTL